MDIEQIQAKIERGMERERDHAVSEAEHAERRRKIRAIIEAARLRIVRQENGQEKSHAKD
jgi:hypothetical protein